MSMESAWQSTAPDSTGTTTSLTKLRIVSIAIVNNSKQ